MKLLRSVDDSEELSAIATTPIVTGSVRKHHFETTKAKSARQKAIDQHGLLARDVSGSRAPDSDPRVFYNVSPPNQHLYIREPGLREEPHTVYTIRKLSHGLRD